MAPDLTATPSTGAVNPCLGEAEAEAGADIDRRNVQAPATAPRSVSLAVGAGFFAPRTVSPTLTAQRAAPTQAKRARHLPIQPESPASRLALQL